MVDGCSEIAMMSRSPSGTARMSPSPTTLVEEVLGRKRMLEVSRSKLRWAASNLLGAALLASEANGLYFFSDPESSAWRSRLSFVETLLIALLVANAVLDLIKFAFPYSSFSLADFRLTLAREDLTLSPEQMKLFRVDPGLPGFKVRQSPGESSGRTGGTKPHHHPFGFPAPLEGSFIGGGPASPLPACPPSSPASGGNSSAMFCCSQSCNYFRTYDGDGGLTSPSSGRDPRRQYSGASNLQGSPNLSGRFAALGKESEIRDMIQLDKYLRNYERWEKSFASVSSFSGGNSIFLVDPN